LTAGIVQASLSLHLLNSCLREPQATGVPVGGGFDILEDSEEAVAVSI